MSEPANKNHHHPAMFILVIAALLMAMQALDRLNKIEKNAPHLLEKPRHHASTFMGRSDE